MNKEVSLGSVHADDAAALISLVKFIFREGRTDDAKHASRKPEGFGKRMGVGAVGDANVGMAATGVGSFAAAAGAALLWTV